MRFILFTIFTCGLTGSTCCFNKSMREGGGAAYDFEKSSLLINSIINPTRPRPTTRLLFFVLYLLEFMTSSKPLLIFIFSIFACPKAKPQVSEIEKLEAGRRCAYTGYKVTFTLISWHLNICKQFASCKDCKIKKIILIYTKNAFTGKIMQRLCPRLRVMLFLVILSLVSLIK